LSLLVILCKFKPPFLLDEYGNWPNIDISISTDISSELKLVKIKNVKIWESMQLSSIQIQDLTNRIGIY
jgi:hypothetical protein